MTPSIRNRDNRRSAVCSLIEVALAVGVILVYLWWGKFTPWAGVWLAATYLVIICVLIFSFRFHHDTARKVGLRFDNIGRALRISLPWLLLVLAGVTTLAFWNGAAMRVDRAKDIWLYFPWGFAQQYFLQAFLLQRMKQAAGRWLGGMLAASIFALVHLPNTWLVMAVWMGAILSVLLFEQVPNLPVLGLEHALVAITLLVFFKHSFLGQFAIGPPLQKFTLRGAGVRLAAWDLDGDGRVELIVVPAATPAKGSPLKIFKQDVLWKSTVPFPDSPGGLEVAGGVLDADGGRDTPPGHPYNAGDPQSEIESIRIPHSAIRNRINPQSATRNPQSDESAIRNPQSNESAFGTPQSAIRNRINPQSAISNPQFFRSPRIVVARGPADGNSDEVLVLSPDLRIVRKFFGGKVMYGASVAIVADRILIGPGPSPRSKPIVEVHDAYGKMISVFALNERYIANGARVTGGLSNSQGGNLLVTPQPLSTNPAVCFIYDLQGHLVRSFRPYQGLTYGMNCAVAHWDGQDFLLFAPGPGRGYRADIRVFNVNGKQVAAFEGGFSSYGASLAAGDWDGDGQDEIFVGAGINPDGDYRVRVLDRNGHLLREWRAF